MKTKCRKLLSGIAVALGLGLLPPALVEGLPRVLQVPFTVFAPGAAHAQYGTSRRVARRTSRRTSSRHAYYGNVATYGAGVPYVTALPAGCVMQTIAGVGYHRCGATYYRPYYEGDTLVYVVESPP